MQGREQSGGKGRRGWGNMEKPRKVSVGKDKEEVWKSYEGGKEGSELYVSYMCSQLHCGPSMVPVCWVTGREE